VVGGNPPNHPGDFSEGIRIKALFSKGQCGPCVVCKERGLGKWLGGLGIDSRLLGDRKLSLRKWMKGMEKEVRILCVILMEDGWRIWVYYVALMFY
jgi:hypothetical protein